MLLFCNKEMAKAFSFYNVLHFDIRRDPFLFRFFIWYLFRFGLLPARTHTLAYAFLLWKWVAVIIMWVYCNTSNDFCCRLHRRNDIDKLHFSICIRLCRVRLRIFFFLSLLIHAPPHSVSFWFVSYDTITKQSLFHSYSLPFFGPLLSFTLTKFTLTRTYIRAHTHSQSSTLLWNAKKGVLLFTLFMFAFVYFYSWYVQQFVIFLLHSSECVCVLFFD